MRQDMLAWEQRGTSFTKSPERRHSPAVPSSPQKAPRKTARDRGPAGRRRAGKTTVANTLMLRWAQDTPLRPQGLGSLSTSSTAGAGPAGGAELLRADAHKLPKPWLAFRILSHPEHLPPPAGRLRGANLDPHRQTEDLSEDWGQKCQALSS